MSTFKNRYAKNAEAITMEETDRLHRMSACVVGCGGLGGYVIELLGRLGVGTITAIDGDSFDETNLNRQLLAEEALIGKEKAITAKVRMALVNSETWVNSVCEYLDEGNSRELVRGHDIVIDAVDNIESRKILGEACGKENIALIHGAVEGWCGQVSVIMPGSRTFEKIYPGEKGKGHEQTGGNLPFVVATVASIQAGEAVKVLLGKPTDLTEKLLLIDLLRQEYEMFGL